MIKASVMWKTLKFMCWIHIKALIWFDASSNVLVRMRRAWRELVNLTSTSFCQFLSFVFKDCCRFCVLDFLGVESLNKVCKSKTKQCKWKQKVHPASQPASEQASLPYFAHTMYIPYTLYTTYYIYVWMWQHIDI